MILLLPHNLLSFVTVVTNPLSFLLLVLFLPHIGHTMLRSLKGTFTLSNVLHIPHITKPLLSIQKFYRDNNVYFEFHASVFYVKDLTTKAVLLSSQRNDGLYVLSESPDTTIPQAYWSPCVFATVDLWHR